MSFISRQEELLLLAIWRLGKNAYGVSIRESLISLTGKNWSIGAVYDVLDRLTRKNLVSTRAGSPTKVRGGKGKRFYSINKKGYQALEEVKKLQQEMWLDLPDPAIE